MSSKIWSGVNPVITVADSKTVTVGAAKTLVVDILNIETLFES